MNSFAFAMNAGRSKSDHLNPIVFQFLLEVLVTDPIPQDRGKDARISALRISGRFVNHFRKADRHRVPRANHLTNLLHPPTGWLGSLFLRTQAAEKNLNFFHPYMRLGSICKQERERHHAIESRETETRPKAGTFVIRIPNIPLAPDSQRCVSQSNGEYERESRTQDDHLVRTPQGWL